MNTHNRFDVIIAGSGAAGLSLLWRTLRSPLLKEKKILLIDQSIKAKDDKTWCFWENIELPDSNLLLRTWDKLLVKINSQTFEESLSRYKYQCLKSIDFTQHILDKAKRNPQVTFCEAKITGFSAKKDVGVAHTSQDELEAQYVFQSMLNPPDFSNLKVDISLLQHFLGWEIECKREVFDSSTATFMDFDVPQINGLSFMYLLPFSATKALVEYTVFSKKVMAEELYEKTIHDYLKATFGLDSEQYEILKKESGAIPMEDRKYPSRYCKNVYNIGTVGGLAKSSTGYTFSRIQKHSGSIIKALENGTKIPDYRLSPYRFRVYDLMMLYLLERETENSVLAFERLFRKNSIDRVLQFLAEQTNPIQDLSIMLNMPPAPFFRSVYKMKHRIFTGA